LLAISTQHWEFPRPLPRSRPRTNKGGCGNIELKLFLHHKAKNILRKKFISAAHSARRGHRTTSKNIPSSSAPQSLHSIQPIHIQWPPKPSAGYNYPPQSQTNNNKSDTPPSSAAPTAPTPSRNSPSSPTAHPSHAAPPPPRQSTAARKIAGIIPSGSPLLNRYGMWSKMRRDA
jgi:hypothetical protein